MGFYGTLVSDGTHLNLTNFHPADGKFVPKVSAPADFVARYARFQSLIDLRQSNYSPDLPTVAGVITQMAQERGWGHYDGIFMVDTIWMQYMLEATGPIKRGGPQRALTSDNVVDVLGKQVPTLPEGPSNALQGRIGQAVWSAIQTSTLSPAAFATALSRSVGGAAHAAVDGRPRRGGVDPRPRRGGERRPGEEPALRGVGGPVGEQDRGVRCSARSMWTSRCRTRAPRA